MWRRKLFSDTDLVDLLKHSPTNFLCLCTLTKNDYSKSPTKINRQKVRNDSTRLDPSSWKSSIPAQNSNQLQYRRSNKNAAKLCNDAKETNDSGKQK